MDGKTNEVMVRKHVEVMSNNSHRSTTNEQKIAKLELKIDNLENTYSILSKVETQIENINEKIDTHLTKKTVADRLLDALVPVLIYGSFMAYIIFSRGGF
jgi:transcription termination factor NusB